MKLIPLHDAHDFANRLVKNGNVLIARLPCGPEIGFKIVADMEAGMG